jgi:hypothetical protein
MSNPNLLLYTVNDFKTMDEKTERCSLTKDTSFYSGNLRYDTYYHAIAKRLSRSKYNGSNAATSEIPFTYRFYKNSTNSAALLIGTESCLKVGYDALGIFSNIKTGLVSNTWDAITYKNLCYLFNGEDDNQVFTLSAQTQSVKPSLLHQWE